MPVKVRRHMGSGYRTKGRKLPEDLEFLKNVTSYAITENVIGKSRKILIEFEPRIIKNIIAKARISNSLKRQVESIGHEKYVCKRKLAELGGCA